MILLRVLQLVGPGALASGCCSPSLCPAALCRDPRRWSSASKPLTNNHCAAGAGHRDLRHKWGQSFLVMHRIDLYLCLRETQDLTSAGSIAHSYASHPSIIVLAQRVCARCLTLYNSSAGYAYMLTSQERDLGIGKAKQDRKKSSAQRRLFILFTFHSFLSCCALVHQNFITPTDVSLFSIASCDTQIWMSTSAQLLLPKPAETLLSTAAL